MKGKYFVQLDKIENYDTITNSGVLTYECHWEDAVKALNITFTNRLKFWKVMLSEESRLKTVNSIDFDFFIDKNGSNYDAYVDVSKFSNAVNHVINTRFKRISEKKVKYTASGFYPINKRFKYKLTPNFQCHE